jgi:hypothetical protein
VQKYSLIFRSKIFGNNFEEFSEILIIDGAGVEELNGAILFVI